MSWTGEYREFTVSCHCRQVSIENWRFCIIMHRCRSRFGGFVSSYTGVDRELAVLCHDSHMSIENW